MYLNKKSINNLDRIQRINLMNSISGIKPALLIGTKSKENVPNLAIFSSIVHINSNPSLFGFFLRTTKNNRRDTYQNIMANKVYTLNHVNTSIIKNSHYTSLKFNANISEFSLCNLTEQYIDDFYAPFVEESKIKIGLKLKEVVKLKTSNSKLVVGEVEHIISNDKFYDETYTLRLDHSDSICVGGLNSYYSLKKELSFPYISLKNINSIQDLL